MTAIKTIAEQLRDEHDRLNRAIAALVSMADGFQFVISRDSYH
jgi:uncharacterized protein YoaH (UPF0181 family)